MERSAIRSVAFGGFDKEDVARYIEQLSQETEKLREERDALQEKADCLEKEADELRTQVQELTKAREELSAEMARLAPLEKENAQLKEQVEALLKQSFRPEFLNRLDEIILFKPLTKENIVKIIDLQMDALNARLADKQLRCELTPEAKQFIIDAAYDPQYGARPLRRYLQHTVETLLARRIVEGNVSPGATLRVEVRDDALQVV